MTILPVYLIKIGVMVLKEFQDPLLLLCVGHIEQKMAEYAGDLTYLTAYGWAYTSYDPRL